MGEDEGSLERGKLVLWGDAKGTAEYLSVLFPFSNPWERARRKGLRPPKRSGPVCLHLIALVQLFFCGSPPQGSLLPLRSCTLSKDVIVGSFVPPAQQSSP